MKQKERQLGVALFILCVHFSHHRLHFFDFCFCWD